MTKEPHASPDRTGREAHVDCLVIGAGPSGLVALKELAEQGLSVLALEAQPGLGGVFRSSYDFMRLVTSSNHIFFGSFPHGDESSPIIWDKHGYIDYLTRFANHFSLMPRIRFSTRVTEVTRNGQGVFRVLAEDGRVFTSNSLVVCSGVHTTPKRLALTGLDSFKGEVLHSADLRDGLRFAGRRVLIVGLGESGSDIALEVSKHAEAVCISTRGGPGFVIPRYFGGKVTDLDTNRCHHSLPYQVFNRWPVKFKVWLETFYTTEADDLNVLKKASEINKSVGRPWKMRTSTKSTSFIEAMLYHGAQYKGGVARVDGNRVVFEDGSDFVCDVILDCTGFRLTFPFLESLSGHVVRRAEKPRSLFKHMIVPELGPDIAFIGFMRPAVGAIPPCSEMQARYLALLLSGERRLPSVEEMQADIAASTDTDLDQFDYHFDKVPWLTDYLRFLDGLAERIGCAPPLTRLFFTDIRLWSKLMFATLTGIHYRLQGPGKDYDAARRVLLTMPTMPVPVLAVELAIKAACEAASWVPRLAFQPRRGPQRGQSDVRMPVAPGKPVE